MKPHLKKTWCIGTLDAAFIARLERLLWLYALPLDPRFPVVCFDERPCFLIGDTVAALGMKADSVRKEHYEYAKHGSCALLMSIEPLTGTRLARVYDQRRKREYAVFLKELAARYPEAVKIRLVQDNLNTHDLSSLYETFAAEEAFALSQRFEFYQTPKKASWRGHDRDRVLGTRATMPRSADRHQSGTRTRGAGVCQRTSRQVDHNHLAVFDRVSQK